MSGVETHACPRCELLFLSRAEMSEHLRVDHGVRLGDDEHDLVTEAVATEAERPRDMMTVALDPASAPPAAAVAGPRIARQAGMGVELLTVAEPGISRTTIDSFLRARQRAIEVPGAVPAGRVVLDERGTPAERIVDHANNASVAMLCLSTRASSAVGELVLGSVAEEVIRHAPVPVLLFGPHVPAEAGEISRVVVCVDGSEHAERAVEAAIGLAPRLHAELFITQVLEPSTTGPSDVAETAYLSRLAARAPSLDIAWDTLHSRHPGRAIVEFADRVPGTLIVMGTHGRRGLRRLVMGSVALEVVRHAHSPVVVLPPTMVGADGTEDRVSEAALASNGAGA
ncbi:MAG: universal stress protein [Actinomycetota bacterium]|nr:universal stress protein [Actinomycetota bacterium]